MHPGTDQQSSDGREADCEALRAARRYVDETAFRFLRLPGDAAPAEVAAAAEDLARAARAISPILHVLRHP